MDEIASGHTQKEFRNFWKKYNSNSRPGRPVSVEGVAEKFKKTLSRDIKKIEATYCWLF